MEGHNVKTFQRWFQAVAGAVTDLDWAEGWSIAANRHRRTRPRIGSFELVLRYYDSVGEQQSILLYSKLASFTWPHMPKLISKLEAVVREVSTVEGGDDSGSGGGSGSSAGKDDSAPHGERFEDRLREGARAMMAIFQQFDKDGSGVITAEELSQGISSLGLAFTPRELEAFLRTCDRDATGTISYHEFAATLRVALGRQEHLFPEMPALLRAGDLLSLPADLEEEEALTFKCAVNVLLPALEIWLVTLSDAMLPLHVLTFATGDSAEQRLESDDCPLGDAVQIEAAGPLTFLARVRTAALPPSVTSFFIMLASNGPNSHPDGLRVRTQIIRDGKKLAQHTFVPEDGSQLPAALMISAAVQLQDDSSWSYTCLHDDIGARDGRFLHLGSFWEALVKHGVQQQNEVHVEYCCDCDKHQMTTWHDPSYFEDAFQAVSEAVGSTFERTVVRGNHFGTPRIGAFEVQLRERNTEEMTVIYSALHGTGSLPDAAVIIERLRPRLALRPPLTRPTVAAQVLLIDGYDGQPIPGVSVRVEQLYHDTARMDAVASSPRCCRSCMEAGPPLPVRGGLLHCCFASASRRTHRQQLLARIAAVAADDDGVITADRLIEVMEHPLSREDDPARQAEKLRFILSDGFAAQLLQALPSATSVVEEETLLAVADKLLKVQDAAQRVPCHTDPEGYWMALLLSGNYVLHLSADGYIPRSSPPLIAREDYLPRCRLQMMPRMYKLSMQLIDEGGGVVHGAGVQIHLCAPSNGRVECVHTEADGSALMHLPADSYEVELGIAIAGASSLAEAPHHLKRRLAGLDKLLKLKLPPVALSGDRLLKLPLTGLRLQQKLRIVDGASGVPLAGAKCSLCLMGVSTAERHSDAEGEAELTVPLGLWQLRVSAPGFLTDTRVLSRALQGADVIVVALCPALADDELMAILTWAEQPDELDLALHRELAADDGSVSAAAGTVWAASARSEDAELVTQADTGFGPTSLRLRPQVGIRYRVVVVSHCDCIAGAMPRLCVWGADGMLASFTCPAGASGRYWDVFWLTVGEGGQLKAVNELRLGE
eukprot:PLAT6420.2.p1 GENE.PLAT6420.2~~PLAT6420.2.p1  ORF type:complete len:1102 (-),score=488.70 PLAT6420.2:1169-4333(-)